mmetsp:Transcript_25183/g.44911  ORF Transcript_25183/g.44911 Transcript_25183/m.44911 type:complete len:120 (+) Transcript_25183:1203-1562(+)
MAARVRTVPSQTGVVAIKANNANALEIAVGVLEVQEHSPKTHWQQAAMRHGWHRRPSIIGSLLSGKAGQLSHVFNVGGAVAGDPAVDLPAQDRVIHDKGTPRRILLGSAGGSLWQAYFG